jgi:hypothetical protein
MWNGLVKLMQRVGDNFYLKTRQGGHFLCARILFNRQAKISCDLEIKHQGHEITHRALEIQHRDLNVKHRALPECLYFNSSYVSGMLCRDWRVAAL